MKIISMKLLPILLWMLPLFIFSQSYDVAGINGDLKKNANAVLRLDETKIEIKSVSDMVYQFHTVKTIFSKDYVDFATPIIHYSKGDRISNIEVIVYDANGKKINNFSKKDFNDFANNSQSTFYSDSRALVLNYVPVSFPYTIDFSYEFQTENTIFIPDFIPFRASNIALELATYSIENRTSIPLKTKEYPTRYGLAKIENIGSGNNVAYRYQNIPAVVDESLSPDLEVILPKVSFALEKFNLEGHEGSISSWEDFGKWYYQELLIPVSSPTDEIKREIAALNLQGSIDEKVKKIYQFMQSKTRYINVALGIGGWQPMLPEEVQEKGYGDCKGLSNYMRTLLNAAGIPSNYCIINASGTPISFDKDFPKMGGNHIVLMVPTENGNIWLENTSQKVAFNHLSFRTTDRNVLSVSSKGIDIIETPVYPAEKNREIQKLNIQLHEDRSITGKVALSYTGSQYDFNLPLVSLDAKDRESYVRNQFESLNFDQLKAEQVINNQDDAKLSYEMDFKASNYSKSLGNSMLFRSVPIFSRYNLKTNEKRQLPFELPFGYQDEYEINYTFPADYKVDEIPEDQDLKSDYGSYTLNFKKTENGLQIKRLLKIKKGLFPKENYNAYVEFRNKVMNADNSKILITKP